MRVQGGDPDTGSSEMTQRQAPGRDWTLFCQECFLSGVLEGFSACGRCSPGLPGELETPFRLWMRAQRKHRWQQGRHVPATLTGTYFWVSAGLANPSQGSQRAKAGANTKLSSHSPVAFDHTHRQGQIQEQETPQNLTQADPNYCKSQDASFRPTLTRKLIWGLLSYFKGSIYSLHQSQISQRSKKKGKRINHL